jgi:hypothetical protein
MTFSIRLFCFQCDHCITSFAIRVGISNSIQYRRCTCFAGCATAGYRELMCNHGMILSVLVLFLTRKFDKEQCFALIQTHLHLPFVCFLCTLSIP